MADIDDPRPYTILIEGNVGSGKSTTLKYFSERRSDVEIVYEPVSKWQNVSGVDLLQLMFDHPQRYSGTFQFYSGKTNTNIQRIDLFNTITRLFLLLLPDRHDALREYAGPVSPAHPADGAFHI